MLRALKPNLTGLLLMIAVLVPLAIPRNSVQFSPGGAVTTHAAVGFPTWVSWDDPGTWRLHAAAPFTLITLWCLAMLLGATLQRWSAWRLPRHLLRAAAVIPVVALATGVAFSLHYWGYPWSLPSLDPRLSRVHWSSVASFTSKETGTAWAREARDRLSTYRSEPAADLECCETGRILKVIGANQSLDAVPAIAEADLAALESEALALTTIERGAPGYEGALLLRGVLATGQDETGAQVAFVSFVGGEVSNDHHAAQELFWRRAPIPVLLSSTRYSGDVAGIEGFTALGVTLVLMLVGSALLPALLLLWTLGRAGVQVLWRRTGRRQAHVG